MTRFIALHFEGVGPTGWETLCGRTSDNLTCDESWVTCRHCQRMIAARIETRSDETRHAAQPEG
jgi:hypothetical protein